MTKLRKNEKIATALTGIRLFSVTETVLELYRGNQKTTAVTKKRKSGNHANRVKNVQFHWNYTETVQFQYSFSETEQSYPG